MRMADRKATSELRRTILRNDSEVTEILLTLNVEETASENDTRQRRLQHPPTGSLNRADSV